jgi:archaellum component FlaC
VGKDIGQILERLERLDNRLNEIERRLDRLEKNR